MSRILLKVIGSFYECLSNENLSSNQFCLTNLHPALANGVNDEGATCSITDGGSSASSKRTGWIASIFGSSKPLTAGNSGQELEETSETDGGVKKKSEKTKKEEHLSVPSKGK